MSGVFSLLFTAMLVSSCEQETPPVLDGETLEQEFATHLLTQTTIELYDTARAKAVITAGTTMVFDQRQETHFEQGVTVEFYSATSGKRVSILTAKKVVIQDRTRDMTAEGNVKVIADSSQTTLESQVLFWSDARQKLHSPEYVKVVSPTETVEGLGFESDKKLANYKFYKVKAIQYSSQFQEGAPRHEQTLPDSRKLEDEYNDE